MRLSGLVLSLLAPFALLGCGGSGGGNKQTFNIGIPAILQMSVQSDGVLDPTNRIGDLGLPTAGLLIRLLVRFDISALPPGAVIVEATMTIPQVDVQGDPYGDLSPAIQIDRVNIGGDIDAADYGSPPLQAVVAVLTPTNATIENKTANMATALQLDIDQNFQVSDLRLYFPSSGDGQFDDDYAAFGTGNTAFLNVTYQLP